MSYQDEVILWDGPYGVAVTSVAPTDKTMVEIGIKDIPAGKPFWVVKIVDLPTELPLEEWVIADIVEGSNADAFGARE